MRELYVVVAVVMASTSVVFVLLAELEHRYDLSTGSLGLIAGSAFAAALVTRLGLARYADRGYGLLLLRSGVAMASVGLLWFAAATELWQFVAARALLGASVGMIIPAARRATHGWSREQPFVEPLIEGVTTVQRTGGEVLGRVGVELAVQRMGQIITDARLVAAIIDRVTFNAHILKTGTES